MPGAVTFSIDLQEQGVGRIAELSARARDLTVLFNDIIHEWAKDNQDKFDSAIGRQTAGASGGGLEPVDWDALAGSTIKRKQKMGYPDQIMVATGELKDSLTHPEEFFQAVQPQTISFGVPNNPDDADKASYNWAKRQTIFLSLDDQRMIKSNTGNYFRFGDNYSGAIFTQGMDAVRERSARSEIDF
jgi:hypothetical protein